MSNQVETAAVPSYQLRAHQLRVPGATVYYEVRGAGPLLLIVGQPMTSAPFAPLADLLASDHTVVTYDPRGLGQSTVDDPAQPVMPEDEGDDLAAIVAELGLGPAEVFASSGGAVAALALTTRHPESVTTVVAHEPPVCDLLDDGPHVRRVVDEIEAAYDAYGAGAAWGGFVSLVMHQGPVPAEGVPPAQFPPPGADAGEQPTPPEPTAEQQADDALFFTRMLKPFTRYAPEIDTLTATTPRLVVAVGTTPDDGVARRSAVALAAQLGTDVVAFPGDHGGFMGEPDAFATRLREVLAQ